METYTFLDIHLITKKWQDQRRIIEIPEMSTEEERNKIIRKKYPNYIGWIDYYIEDRIGKKVIRRTDYVYPPKGRNVQLFSKEIGFSLIYGSTIEP